jgi:hypothetical protein
MTSHETQHPQYEKERVEDTTLQSIDWHRHEYPLGVRTSLTEVVPGYNALTEAELKCLHLALTKVLPGCSRSLAQEYKGLSELAKWAEQCAIWAKRHP